ncbi:MAG: DUF6994 family protein [Lachnospiraceae bacterium]
MDKKRLEKNIEHCYMDDMYNFSYQPEMYSISRDHVKTINGKKYFDADASCPQLYQDVCRIWNGRTLPNEQTLKIEVDPSEVKLICNGVECTTDYIGPSATEAIDQGISELEIGKSVLHGRTIGGHMFWPSEKKNGMTINVARGRVGDCDRFDLMLEELKRFYAKEEEVIFKGVRGAFERYSDWLMLFNTFEDFCDFFFLTGSFVDEQYNVIRFGKPLHAELDFKDYMKNNVDAIQKRNEAIMKYLQSK